MDIPIKKIKANDWGECFIALADWFQFSKGERIVQPCVESRLFVWCESGNGQLSVNRTTYSLRPGSWLFLPWRARLVYQADRESPFRVGGIHVIPKQAPRRKMTYWVWHGTPGELNQTPGRRDVLWMGLDGVLEGSLQEEDQLTRLTPYIVKRFHSPLRSEAAMRDLSRLLLDEIAAARRVSAHGEAALPAVLRRAVIHLEEHLNQRLSLETMAAAAGTSPATLQRMFRRHFRVSPARHVTEKRMDQAALLLRTTRLPVGEIAQKVGLPDPFHFSRVFKRTLGHSPRAYRQARHFL